MNDNLEAAMEQGKQTYTEMVIAIILQAIVYSVVGLIVTGEYVLFPISVFAGCGVAVGILRHMYNTLDIVLDLDEETAKKYGRRQSVARIGFMGLSLCIAFYFDGYVSPWGFLAGLMALKFSAFLQPLVHQCCMNIKEKRREKSK